MNWLGATDPFVGFALAASAGILMLCTTLLLVIGAFHWRRRWREHQVQKVEATWRPLLLQSIDGTRPDFPPLPAGDRLAVLWLWSRMIEWLEDSARRGLVQSARRLHLDRVARQMLHSPDLRERLLAALMLGNMRDIGSWTDLVEALDEWHATLSMAVARALLRIDARRAVPIVLDKGLQRREWPIGMLLAMLREAGPKVVSEPIRERLQRLQGPALRRLLSLLSIADADRVRPALLARLDESADPEFIAGALRHLDRPEDAGRLGAYTRHENWTVRLRAVHALARMARTEDLPLLVDRLDDPEWWVRLRTAESLLDLRVLPAPELDALIERRGIGELGRQTLAQIRATREDA